MAAKAQVYKAGGKFRYRVKAGNGRVVEAGEQGFANMDDAVARIVRRHPEVAAIDVAYTTYQGTSRERQVKYTITVDRSDPRVARIAGLQGRGSHQRSLRLEGK